MLKLVTDERERGRLLHGVMVYRCRDQHGRTRFTGRLGDGATCWATKDEDVVREVLAQAGMPFRHITKENLNVR